MVAQSHEFEKYRPAAMGGLRSKAGKSLLCLVMLEASLFASGRMLQIGPVTVKMLLYSLALVYTAWCFLLFDRIRTSTAILVVSFAALVSFSAMNGVCHAAHGDLLGEDVSPLMSFLILPFFELTIRSRSAIAFVMRIILACAAIMACLYALIVISFWLSAWLHIEALGVMRQWLVDLGGVDFFIGGDQTGEMGHFFYSGALYLAIGTILCALSKGRWAKLGALLLFFSLFLVASRGFFLTLALTAALYVFIGPMRKVRKLLIGTVFVVLAGTLLPLLFSLSGNKTVSDSQRLNTISQVSERVTPLSFVIGHGFGIGVPEKPEHMEIIYLEIFHKQGIVGLLWWGALIVVLMTRFRKAIRNGGHQYAYPLFLSAVFILVDSATNPFVNNPVGMYPFLAAYVGLGVLGDTSQVPAPTMNLALGAA